MPPRLVLSSHVLDTSVGRPLAGVTVELYKDKGSEWLSWHSSITNGDGRVQFPFTSESMPAGTYKLKFNVEDYYDKIGKHTMFPYVEIVFHIREGEQYHIPLLMSPYGYSTYRGS